MELQYAWNDKIGLWDVHYGLGIHLEHVGRIYEMPSDYGDEWYWETDYGHGYVGSEPEARQALEKSFASRY